VCGYFRADHYLMRNFEQAGINKYRIREGRMGSADAIGNYGAFRIYLKGQAQLLMIVSDGDCSGWEHVSAHVKTRNRNGKVYERTPTWEEMCKVKDVFWGDDETVVQYHPPKSDYVNNHANCLHLFRPYNEEIKRPPQLTQKDISPA